MKAEAVQRSEAQTHRPSSLNLARGFSSMTRPSLSPHVLCHSQLSNCLIKAKYPKSFLHLHRSEMPWDQWMFHFSAGFSISVLLKGLKGSNMQ